MADLRGFGPGPSAFVADLRQRSSMQASRTTSALAVLFERIAEIFVNQDTKLEQFAILPSNDAIASRTLYTGFLAAQRHFKEHKPRNSDFFWRDVGARAFRKQESELLISEGNTIPHQLPEGASELVEVASNTPTDPEEDPQIQSERSDTADARTGKSICKEANELHEGDVHGSFSADREEALATTDDDHAVETKTQTVYGCVPPGYLGVSRDKVAPQALGIPETEVEVQFTTAMAAILPVVEKRTTFTWTYIAFDVGPPPSKESPSVSTSGSITPDTATNEANHHVG